MLGNAAAFNSKSQNISKREATATVVKVQTCKFVSNGWFNPLVSSLAFLHILGPPVCVCEWGRETEIHWQRRKRTKELLYGQENLSKCFGQLLCRIVMTLPMRIWILFDFILFWLQDCLSVTMATVHPQKEEEQGSSSMEVGETAGSAPSPQSEAVTNELQELTLQTAPKLLPIQQRKSGKTLAH